MPTASAPHHATDRMARITAVLESANPMRSALARWMYENHEAFAETLTKHRPDWNALAEAFVKERLMPEASPEAAKAAWQRVRKRVAEEKRQAERKG